MTLAPLSVKKMHTILRARRINWGKAYEQENNSRHC